MYTKKDDHQEGRTNSMKKEKLGETIIESQEKLYHIAKSMLFDDEDCSDAISETIVKAFSKIHTLKSEEYVDTWLVRILINECYNVIRQKKRVVSLEDYMMKSQTTEHKDYTDLYNAIGHLSENERICVSLYYLDGYKVKDIAEILKTTESAVKNRLARARAKMNDESYSMDKIMYINFEKQHYVVQLNLGEDISKDEAVKIAEGVQLVESKVADRAVVDYSDSVAQGKLESTDATAKVTSVDKAKVNLAKVGNSFKESGADDENKLLTGKVTDIKILDNLNILGVDKKNYSEVIDSKGNLLQDTIKYYKSGDGENSIDKVVKSRKVNQKFIYATVQYTNNTNKTIRDFCYGANVMYLEDSGDNIELYEETPGKNDKWDFIEKTSAYSIDEMIYWDVKNNGIHNSIAAIKPGETKTVHIGFIVDEDMLKYTVLNFTDEKTDLSDNVISNGLVDIRQ